MQSKELKKNLLRECPFCGGEAELNYYGSESIPFYSVSCKECGCKQATSIHKEAVINAWNNRATESEIKEKTIDEFAEKLIATFCYEPPVKQKIQLDNVYDGESIREIITEVAEQLKEE